MTYEELLAENLRLLAPVIASEILGYMTDMKAI